MMNHVKNSTVTIGTIRGKPNDVIAGLLSADDVTENMLFRTQSGHPLWSPFKSYAESVTSAETYDRYV